MLTRSLALKKRLRDGETTVGAWLSLSCPAVAEIMAGAGFDWLLIDMEHTSITLENLECTLMAFNGRRTVPIVRVPWNDRVLIKQVLDLGAEGILVPHVDSREEAKQAVAACKYPPQGYRGFGPRRASDYYRNVEEYICEANEGIIVAVQLEHSNAVESARQIMATPGIDVVLLGPMDLSASLGLLGQLDHPQVVSAIEQVIMEGRRSGIPVGVPIDAPSNTLLSWADRGCRFVIVGEDHSFLRRAVDQSLADFRQHLGGR